eukprot:m.30174 g.30174  ORF g.30174 m.30174 type:complete len:82 (-) comp6764_c0_seq1:17-262(-)
MATSSSSCKSEWPYTQNTMDLPGLSLLEGVPPIPELLDDATSSGRTIKQASRAGATTPGPARNDRVEPELSGSVQLRCEAQ